MTMNIDSFVGSQFQTPKKSIITVLRKSEANRRKYVVHCSKCSCDTELFNKPLEMERTHLIRNKVPCGCSLSPKFSREQYKVICSRLFRNDKTLTFVGFKEPYINRDTVAIVRCERHNHEIFTTIRGLLRSEKIKCKHCCEEGYCKPKNSEFDVNKECFLYVVEMEHRTDSSLSFAEIRLNNSLSFYKRNAFKKKYNKDYNINIKFNRYFPNGNVTLLKIEKVRTLIPTTCEDEAIRFKPSNGNIELVINTIK